MFKHMRLLYWVLSSGSPHFIVIRKTKNDAGQWKKLIIAMVEGNLAAALFFVFQIKNTGSEVPKYAAHSTAA